MRKKRPESREKLAERVRKEVERLIDAGELDFMEAEDTFEALLREFSADHE